MARGFRRDQDLLRDRLVKVLYGEASSLYFLAELNEFSNLGKGPETMKVPYAKKWQKETDKLRQIALDSDLTEELKWGKPSQSFTFYEEKRGDRDPAQGVVRVLVLQGRTAQRSEARSRKDWRAYAGGAMD